MFRFGVLLLVAAAVAVPSVTRSRDEIEAFRSYLEAGRIVLLLVAAAVAVPSVTRSRDEIEAFRSYLEAGRIVLLLVAAAVAVPSVTRSRDEIEAFRSYLEAGRIVLLLVAAAVAVPSVTRSRDEIEAFRSYLEAGRIDSGVRIESRIAANPQAKAWENSGKFEGDIILDEEQVQGLVENFATGRNAYIWPNTKWPSNTVVYDFAAGHFSQSARNAILEAMRDIERNTCIRFRQRNNWDWNYTLITAFTDGCYAHVGYWSSRGVHTLNLAWPSCSLHTTIVHEWLHIIGFVHMQSTHNRDDYVRILWQNIWPGMEHNFDKYATSVVNNMNLPYDYASTMHYGGYGFSTNGQPTMVALYDHTGIMGQQYFISNYDWLRVNRHYNCPGAWSRDALLTPQQRLVDQPLDEQPLDEQPLDSQPLMEPELSVDETP